MDANEKTYYCLPCVSHARRKLMLVGGRQKVMTHDLFLRAQREIFKKLVPLYFILMRSKYSRKACHLPQLT